MHPFIEEIYRTGRVQDELGHDHALHSHVDRAEGEYLANLIRADTSIRKTLEVGCAYGLSSLFICSALAGREQARHVIIDPSQYEVWKGIGVSNLERAGFDCFELIQEPSEFVLPKLAQGEPGSFDLIFIDGWHTFDHALLDMFYANLLIRIGGYVVVDDCDFPSVAKAVAYLENYPAYQMWSMVERRESLKRKLAKLFVALVPKTIWNHATPNGVFNRFNRARYTSMVALKKTAEDNRGGVWYEPF